MGFFDWLRRRSSTTSDPTVNPMYQTAADTGRGDDEPDEGNGDDDGDAGGDDSGGGNGGGGNGGGGNGGGGGE